MIILASGVIMFMLFLCFVIGFTVYKMLVQKVTPQIYYTPFDSISAQSRVEFHEEQGDREKRAEKDNDR
ncbi:DUF3951 domain-containing protein [Bacillus sp. JJ864]|uniref:DUF3951 domain-containing protein n=1 Tax=Bacillus sp. JJ864 TaxID=3122975 RepID=UPI003000F253